jgi:glycosyltransferase involved in cell wall biosynthesis
MRIACLIASVSRNAGGLYESVRRLCQSLHTLPGAEVHVLGMIDEHTHADVADWSPVPTHVFPVQGPREFGYAPRLKEKLFELDADIVMVHGLWMYPTVAGYAWHRHTRRPFMINPHGMLDPWAVNNSYWKKRMAGFLHENSNLRHAACLRALCWSEVESIRAYGLRNPVCLIPNGIDLPDGNAASNPPWEGKVSVGRKVLLYLGRIHPKKGLVHLLRAWALLRHRRSISGETWELVIAGWSQNDHEWELKNLARQLEIEEDVHFPGSQFGPAKEAAYRHADAFVLPSLSEGLPMVVLEAWAHRLPVIMTPPCHLPEGFEAEAAIRVEPEVESLVQGLETLFSMDQTERERMGRRGHQLVAERFNWPKIGTQIHDVCRWLQGETDPPECLRIHQENIQNHEHSLV